MGEKGKDNGILILLAMEDRKARIEVGYGLEGAISDLRAKEILNQILIPKIKAGQPPKSGIFRYTETSSI